jgi:hypothetical protein
MKMASTEPGTMWGEIHAIVRDGKEFFPNTYKAGMRTAERISTVEIQGEKVRAFESFGAVLLVETHGQSVIMKACRAAP